MLAPALLIAFAIGSQSDSALDKKVSLTCPATPAAVVARMLSEQAGVPLSAPDPMSGEMLVLRFKEVPLRVVMDKIAAAATGEWSRKDGGYELTRPMTLIHAVEHAERLKRIAMVKEALAARAKEFGRFDANIVRAFFDAMRKESESLRGRSDNGGIVVDRKEKDTPSVEQPSDRFATRVLSTMSPEDLADLPTGQRVVFSTRPTNMQRPLSGSLLSAVQEFVREQAIWDKVSSEHIDVGAGGAATGGVVDDFVVTGTGTGTGGVRRYRDSTAFYADAAGGWGDGTSITHPVAKILAVMTAQWDSSIDVRFKICDAAGQIMANPGTALSLADPADKPEESEKADDAGKSEVKHNSQPIPLSSIATELRDLLGNGQGYDEAQPRLPKPASPALRQFVVRPEAIDPLTVFPSEPLLGVAEAKDLNVAVCVDDESFSATSDAKGDADEMLASLSDAAKVDKGWLTGQPSDRLHAHHESRKALGEFLRASEKMGRLGLEPLGAYAQSVPEFEGSLGGDLSRVLFMSPDWGDGGRDWLYVRLFGSLSGTQRDMLGRGAKLSLDTMSGSQMATIAAIVYRREIEDEGTSQEAPAVIPEGQTDIQIRAQMLEAMMMGVGSLKGEPTELLPNGLLMRITLGMTSQDDPVVFTSFTMNGMTMPSQALDADNVAMMLAGAEYGNFGLGGENFSFKIGGYRMGRRQTYDMTLNLPEKCSDSGSVSDSLMGPDPFGTLDKLPPDVRKQIQDRMAEMKKAWQEMGSNWNIRRHGGDNGVPPPRP
ncbi:MAG: hypothetical protein ACHQ50_07335 [Fimbriimonadales bacterium]